jgi:hypothetical protein
MPLSAASGNSPASKTADKPPIRVYRFLFTHRHQALGAAWEGPE